MMFQIESRLVPCFCQAVISHNLIPGLPLPEQKYAFFSSVKWVCDATFEELHVLLWLKCTADGQEEVFLESKNNDVERCGYISDTPVSFWRNKLIPWLRCNKVILCWHTGQQDETLCKNYISELKDLRLRIEDCEAGTVERIRKPMEKEPLKQCVQKTTEQKVLCSVMSWK